MSERGKDERIAPGERPLPTSAPQEHFPEEAGPLPPLARAARDEAQPRLKSLAQSARGNQLNAARNWLLFVGIITIAANGFFLFNYRAQIMAQLQKQGIQQMPPQVEQALQLDYLMTGGFILSGVIFIVLALFVKSYPVPCTVAGLVLYIACWLVSGVLNPAAFMAGIIIKIIVIVAMFKAIQAALAYERERHAVAVE